CRAGHALRPRDVRPTPGERPVVGRAPRGHPRPRGSRSPPAAARSVVQEAWRLRDAREAGRPAGGGGAGEAEATLPMIAAAPPVAGRDELLMAMADDEFVIGFSDSEWTGIAPMLEEDV